MVTPGDDTDTWFFEAKDATVTELSLFFPC